MVVVHSGAEMSLLRNSHSSGSGDSAANNSSNTADTSSSYLKHLNKLSHKISKPTVKKPSFDNPLDHNHAFRPPALPPPPTASQPQQQQQHQPPVYNINKNDFRDVVQKLTGSPAHERFATPPPKPHSTRLQRIRPPPLLTGAAPPFPHPVSIMNPNNPVGSGAPGPAPNFNSFGRSLAPLSPLPPLPSVHGSAESPVSAYMRFLHNSSSNLDPNPRQQFPGFSPLAPAPPPQHQFQLPPPQLQPQFQLPSSPLPFGCSNSPKSGVLFSPSSGFPQFPLSPKVPATSPRCSDL